MTIYTIKRLTSGKLPYYFNRDTMRFFGQTLRDFSVKKQIDGRYLISATMKDRQGKKMGVTQRLFNPLTNTLDRFN